MVARTKRERPRPMAGRLREVRKGLPGLFAPLVYHPYVRPATRPSHDNGSEFN